MEGGRALYDRYSTVSDSGAHNFLRLRETVLLRKEARKMFVQANTKVNGMYQLLSLFTRIHQCLYMHGNNCRLLHLQGKLFFVSDSVFGFQGTA